MHKIERKTTGTLIDELITCMFKIEHSSTRNLYERFYRLFTAILDRVSESDLDGCQGQILDLFLKLGVASKECWDAQEMICASEGSPTNIAEAARTAQSCNAERVSIIREIDDLFGEENEMALEKTYD